MWNFYTVLLQIHSGNCLQKIDLLDLSLIKLLQNEQGCNFFASQCKIKHEVDRTTYPRDIVIWNSRDAKFHDVITDVLRSVATIREDP